MLLFNLFRYVQDMNKGKSYRPNKKNQKNLVRKSVIGVIFFAVLITVVYIIGRQAESSSRENAVRGDLNEINGGKTVEYNGHKYRYKSNILTILFMGTDQTAETVASNADFRNGGQADFLMLMIIDPDEQSVTQLHIDRDTMTEITILGVTGNVSGKREAQICLSHGFGDGAEQSCEFTKEAVENLLNGIEVDFYIALRMDAINELNEAVGGVTVKIEDDFSQADPTLVMGNEIKLHGEQAETYVRNRMDVGDGTNEARIRRQQNFFSGFSDVLEQKISQDKDYVGVIYDMMGQALITDMKRGRMINEANKAMGYERGTRLSLQGEHAEVDGFVQFRADEAALEKMVMDTFYTRIQ